MSNLSLTASLRTCRVEQGHAIRAESDRFLNSENTICIPWNGYDLTGRAVNADTFRTKMPGCNLALDRVAVESFLRPQYAEYITLDTSGIDGDIYGNQVSRQEVLAADQWNNSRHNVSGQFGSGFQQNIGSCGVGAYERAMSQTQEMNRRENYANSSYNAHQRRKQSGF
jgi:hypothetical protein